MTFRDGLLVSTFALGLAAAAPNPAWAGLLGAANTVAATYYFLNLSSAESENAVTFGSTAPVSLASPVNYIEGPDDVSTITVADTHITITNLGASGLTYCNDGASAGSACTDPIDGFEFKFTGENITGASIDGATPADFTVATFGSHLGLQLLNNNDLLIDLTGSAPQPNEALTIDLSFAAVLPVPEPASMTLFGVAVGGLMVARRRSHPA